jgi:O-antigen ligase
LLGIVGVCLAALAVTFTRAGYIGFGAGLLLYGLFSSTKQAAVRWIVGAMAVLAVLNFVVLPSLNKTSNSSIYKRGVLRQGTFQAREDYWRLALPIATDTPKHLIVGRGYGTLLGGNQGGAVDSSLATAPVLITSGPHNQYVRTMLEEGVVGLGALIIWLVASMQPAVRARGYNAQTRRYVAALAAAVLAFAVTSGAGDTFRDAQTIGLISLVTGLCVTTGQLGRRQARARTPS